ncbi:MAG TPA: PEGA domain-containing protein [Myxococcales bacterium]
MGTYRTTRIPGSRDGESKRLLGVNSLGQAAYLTRACPPGHPSRGVLERFVKTAVDLREVAGLVEIAEDESGVYVVEVAEPSLPLQVVVERAQALGKPAPPDLAAWMALRVCQVSSALRLPHLRLSLRNVFVRPDGEPYLLGALWARQLPPEPDDAPFVPPQPLEDAKIDAFAAAAIARALAGGIEGFPPPLKSALEAASGGPGWAWMLPSKEAAAAIEKALGPEAVRSAPARMAAWLRTLELPAPAPFDAGGPTLRLMPVNRLNTSEELALPGGPAMSMDGRVDGPVGRSARPLTVDAVPHTRIDVSRESEKIELDEVALAHANAPQQALAGSMVHKVQAELNEARSRRTLRRAMGVVAVLLLLGVGAAGFWYLRSNPSQLAGLVGGKEVTALLRVESTPPGATVSIAGQALGETPFVCLNEYEGSTLRVELAGHEPAIQTLGAGSRTVRLVLKPLSGAKSPGPKPNRPGAPAKKP